MADPINYYEKSESIKKENKCSFPKIFAFIGYTLGLVGIETVYFFYAIITLPARRKTGEIISPPPDILFNLTPSDDLVRFLAILKLFISIGLAFAGWRFGSFLCSKGKEKSDSGLQKNFSILRIIGLTFITVFLVIDFFFTMMALIALVFGPMH